MQNGLIPVFVDCKVGTYNIDVDLLEAGLSDGTRAVFVPCIPRNPVEMDAVMAFAAAHDLYVIEDTCDALGSSMMASRAVPLGIWQPSGSIQPTTSPPVRGRRRQNDSRLHHIAHTIRDWGRDCWCDHRSDRNGECGRRFDWEIPGWASPMTTATISPRSATTSR